MMASSLSKPSLKTDHFGSVFGLVMETAHFVFSYCFRIFGVVAL